MPGIEKITQRVGRGRIANSTQGNEAGLHQLQVISGGGEDLFQNRDGLGILNFPGKLDQYLLLPQLLAGQQGQQLPGALHHPAQQQIADNHLRDGYPFFTDQQPGQQGDNQLPLQPCQMGNKLILAFGVKLFKMVEENGAFNDVACGNNMPQFGKHIIQWYFLCHHSLLS